MANTKISELSAASALDGTEAFPANQGGTTKRTDPSAMLAYVANNMVRVAGRTTSAPTFSSGSVTSNVATINTASAHGLLTDQVVTISGSSGVTVDGTFGITVTSTTAFTFNITVGNGTITAATITPKQCIQIGRATNHLQGFNANDEVVITTSDNGKRIALHLGGYFGYGAVGSFNNNYDNQYFGFQATQMVISADGNLRMYAGSNALDPAFADSLNLGSSGRKWNNMFSAGYLELKQIASGGTPASNCGRLYTKNVSNTAEVFVMDEAGNETQISEHAGDAPDWLYDDRTDRVSREANIFTGVVKYHNKTRFERLVVDGIRPTRDVGLSTTCSYDENFETHNSRIGQQEYVQLDWDTTQKSLQDDYNRGRAKELSEYNERLLRVAKGIAANEKLDMMIAEATARSASKDEIKSLCVCTGDVVPTDEHFKLAKTKVHNDVRPEVNLLKPQPKTVQTRSSGFSPHRANWKQRLFAWLMK